MKIYIFTRVVILNVLWIVLACFIHDADAQTQVLIKENGAASTELQKANYSDGSGVMTSNIHTVIFYDGTSGHSYFVEAYQDSGASHDVGGTSVMPGCIFTAYKL